MTDIKIVILKLLLLIRLPEEISVLELECHALFKFLPIVRHCTGKQNHTENLYFYIQRTYLNL